jgi:hypothetical protein
MAGRRGALRVELGCRGGDGSTLTNVRTGVDRWCGMVFNSGMSFTTDTAKVARFTRTCNEVPQITFANGIVARTSALPEGMKTVGQAIAQGWVQTAGGSWVR